VVLAFSACAAAAQVPAWPAAVGPALQAAGTGQLTWLGIVAYEARLWVAPEFRHARFAEHPFALELAYRRGFSSAQIAARSIEEMRRAGPLADGEAQRWQARLQQVLPDVKPGDRIVGVHRPGNGATFLVNGQPTGEIADPQFAARFFGIWLAPTTSEPRLRDALLANTRP
jgi:hypothetical protein